MSLRMRLISLKADGEQWENALAAAVAVCFAGAVLGNVRLFFSVRKTPSLFGAVFSWAYVISWPLGALLLRNRRDLLRISLIVRWAAVGAVLLGIAASGGTGAFSALCVMPYALFLSAYAGLDGGALVSYGLILAQALAAALLLRRLRRREARGRRRPPRTNERP